MPITAIFDVPLTTMITPTRSHGRDALSAIWRALDVAEVSQLRSTSSPQVITLRLYRSNIDTTFPCKRAFERRSMPRNYPFPNRHIMHRDEVWNSNTPGDCGHLCALWNVHHDPSQE